MGNVEVLLVVVEVFEQKLKKVIIKMIANNSYDSLPLFTILFGLKINNVGEHYELFNKVKNLCLNHKKNEKYN